jgi:Flp pilus assembly protein TadD
MRVVKLKRLTWLVAVMVLHGSFFQAHAGQKTAEEYITQGKGFLKAKKNDQAVASFTEALKLNPKSLQALNNRGIAYCRQGYFDKAIADFSQVIQMDPNYGKAYNNRAVALWYKGERYKAQEDLKKAESLGIKVDKKGWEGLYSYP